MFKRISSIFITLLMVLLIATSGEAANDEIKITTSMQVIDTFNNVSAYYRSASVEADATDTTYSCAAFAKRYFSNVYGVTLSGLGLNGAPVVNKGKISVVSTPKAGDLAYWSSNPHSAIVKSVNGNTVTLIEQNWKKIKNGSYYAKKERTISVYESGVKFYRWSSSSTTTTNTTSTTSGDVVFYEHTNCQGWSLSRSANFNAQTAGAMGFSNDQLSSIKINTSGITVELYWDSNYQGKCIKFTSKGTYNMTDYGFNDVCSSYKIYRGYSSTSTSSSSSSSSTTPSYTNVIFCGDRDGNGWNVSKPIGTNASNASSLGFSNDQLSSIRIPAVSGGKIYVTIYENENYSGRSYTFSGEGLYNLEPFGFDNICSSYKIWKQ